MPNKNPATNKNGRTIQPKKMIAPAKIMKTCAKRPAIIKTILTSAPKTREIKLEKKTSKYLLNRNPLGYPNLYLRQGEKKVFKSNAIEK